MNVRCDVAVVGIGLVGAAALRYLSRDGLRCVGIGPAEPADWGTHRGVFASHYDSGRITRRLDKRHEWALLASRAIEAYADIESAAGVRFHHPAGVLIAEVDADRLAATEAVGDRLGVPFQRFGPGDDFGDPRVSLPAEATVLREPAPGGFIDPRRMLTAQRAVARDQGAETVMEQVASIERSGEGWRVATIEGTAVVADQVVIAAGPHADEVRGLARRPHLDVVAETVVLAHLGRAECERLRGLPSIIVDDPSHDHLYVVPPTEYPDGNVYLKLGATRRVEAILSPTQRRQWMSGATHRDDLDWLRRLTVGVLPGLHAEKWLTKPCLIPETPTGLPYLEVVEPGLVVAVGGNGYAAKSADAIGELAAGLVINGRWTDGALDPESFRLVSR